METESGPVVGVVGGSGGVGASTFAAVLAAVAGATVLVDVDPVGGGVDVLLGIEDVPGARWSGIRLAGGVLDPDVLRAGLPRWGAVSVLALDADPPPPSSVCQVIDAAASRGPVVVDLGRSAGGARPAAAECCDVVVVVAAGDVRELAAARAVLIGLEHPRVGLVLRRGSVRSGEAELLTGAALVGVVPALGSGRSASRLHLGRLPPRVARVAAGVLDGARAGGRRAVGVREQAARAGGTQADGVREQGAPCPT